MKPIEIYVLFVLPSLIVAVSAGFVVYGRARLRARARLADRRGADGPATLAALEARKPRLKVVNT